MIDRLITDIESEIDTDTTGQVGEAPASGGSTEYSPTFSDSYSVEIIQEGNVIDTFGDSVQSGLMLSVVDHLVQNHDLTSAVQPLPYIPGKKRAIINNSPTYNERKKAQPQELAQGYYLEVNLSWEQKKREIQRLARVCDLAASVNDDPS